MFAKWHEPVDIKKSQLRVAQSKYKVMYVNINIIISVHGETDHKEYYVLKQCKYTWCIYTICKYTICIYICPNIKHSVKCKFLLSWNRKCYVTPSEANLWGFGTTEMGCRQADKLPWGDNNHMNNKV